MRHLSEITVQADQTIRIMVVVEIALFRQGLAELMHRVLPGVEVAEAADFDDAATRLLAEGRLTKDIARRLDISVSTVKAHLAAAYRSLGARNRVEAVVRSRGADQPAFG